MDNKILVTGASGVLGRAIVDSATKAGLPVRQGVRDLKKANPDVESIHLDYADPATVPPALAGASGVLLMAPALDPNAPAELEPVIAAAKAARVRHIVFISAFGVNYSEQAPLRVVEHRVIDFGIPYTILRPNFFMENFSEGFLAPAIRATNAIQLAAGEGKTSFISVQDIAAVVITAFQKAITGVEMDLTGPAALDHSEVAAIISRASGHKIEYRPISERQMVDGARAAGLGEPAILYLTMLYSVVRSGFEAGVTNDVERLLGRKPLSFEEFAQASAAAWK